MKTLLEYIKEFLLSKKEQINEDELHSHRDLVAYDTNHAIERLFRHYKRDDREIFKSDIDKTFEKLRNQIIKYMRDNNVKEQSFVLKNKSVKPTLNIICNAKEKRKFIVDVITVMLKDNFIKKNDNDVELITY